MKVKTKTRRVLEIGGIPEFIRPAYADTLHFPADMSQLTAQNLSELMGKYAGLLAFVEQEATTWEIQSIRLAQSMEAFEGQHIRENPKLMFLERWRIDASVKRDPAMSDMRKRMSHIRVLKERALSLVRTYERLINVLSRELSRRISTNDGSRYSNGA